VTIIRTCRFAFHVSRFTLLLALALPAWAASKDLTIRERTTGDSMSGVAHEETQYWTRTKRVTDGAHARTIVDLEAKTVTMANKDKQTYFVRTFEEMRGHAEGLKKRLEALPPQARQLMGNMMGSAEPVTLKPTGKTEQIAGYKAREYAIEGSGSVSGSVWATDAIQPPTGAGDWEQLTAMLGAPDSPTRRLTEALSQLKGVPLRRVVTTTLGAQPMTITTAVLQVSTEAPPADVLKVPDGFKKVDAPGMMKVP
jgi:hypothetical protein